MFCINVATVMPLVEIWFKEENANDFPRKKGRFSKILPLVGFIETKECNYNNYKWPNTRNWNKRIKQQLKRILLMCHFGNKLDGKVLDNVDAFGVGILIVAETVHHASQFFAEEPFSSHTAQRCVWICSFLFFKLSKKINEIHILQKWTCNKRKVPVLLLEEPPWCFSKMCSLPKK